MKTIGEILSKGIKEGKWISISYHNANEEMTNFWIAIKDIVIKNKILNVDMYNYTKGIKTIDAKIKFENISKAEILFFTSYEVPYSLIDKLEHIDPIEIDWLDYDSFNSNILNYYIECSRLDNDPFQKDYYMIDGIDLSVLKKEKEFKLDEKQIDILLNKIYHEKDLFSSFYELIISIFSITRNNKKYVICYYPLTFNPKNNSLIVGKTLMFNKSFLIEGTKNSLFNYVDGDVDKFIEEFKNKDTYFKCREEIQEHLHKGEIIDTRPDIMLLQRNVPVNLENTYKYIESQYKESKLSRPLKAFFGNLTRTYMVKKEPSIVLFDERVNIDQMRVIYNSMTQPVTYVQGPPGTGKTQTILNVILSAFVNGKTVLISSSNNNPVNGIMEKFKFNYYDNEILFPYLRLGRYEEIVKATKKIRKLFSFKTEKKPNENLIKQILETNDKNNQVLKEKLHDYEKRLELIELIESSNKLLFEFKDKDSDIIEKVKTKVEEYKVKLDSIPYINDDDVLSLFKPINKDTKFLSYLYYQSLKYINKLKTGKFEELINICFIEDDEERVGKFNSWISNDDNMKILLSAFPIILSTNISSAKLGTPNTKFDLVILDEAGQCNVAHSLLPISRGTNLLLVGDTNQLQPVIILDDNINDELLRKYNVDSTYSYKGNSILSIMKNHDFVSKRILLSYHYRCGKKIINFSNKRYYGNELKTSKIKFDGELGFLNIKSNNSSIIKNQNIDECLGIIDYIKRNDVKDATIITPFRNQQELLSSLLKQNGINDINCGTVHSLQGAEKDTIIFSTSISPRTSKRTYEWLKNNAELINVGITRAKKKFVIATDYEALENLSDKSDDLYSLVNYVKNNGMIEISPSLLNNISIGKSNGSKAEDEFYKTISHFCSTNINFEVERNVSFRKIFKNDPILSKSKKEFDLVLYEKQFFTSKVSIVIEINGGEHFGNYNREKSDAEKREICKKQGWKFLSIPNSFVKSYEEIREIILSTKGKEYEQLKLFDD